MVSLGRHGLCDVISFQFLSNLERLMEGRRPRQTESVSNYEQSIFRSVLNKSVQLNILSHETTASLTRELSVPSVTQYSSVSTL